MVTIEGHNVKVFADNVDAAAVEQIRSLVSLSAFADKKIRIMPDVHAGAGCVIGFTGDLGDKVIPNIVGVDIGCGMRVVNLGQYGDVDFHAFHEYIKTHVPSGMAARNFGKGYEQLSGVSLELYRQAKDLVQQLRCYRLLSNTDHINKSAGTLGGGNHFIELNRDDAGNLYLVIHTGSRNLGKQVAEIYQKKAIQHLTSGGDELEQCIQQTIAEYKAAGRRKELQGVIKKMRAEFAAAAPSVAPELCYLEGELREDYLHDMRLCQKWAVFNRAIIMTELVDFFDGFCGIEEVFESIHNYIGDDNIIRKGAISARDGERCIIPMNMRDGSLLCTGKGNSDWNYSAPHGAGRVMSRTQAYAQVSMEDFHKSMEGVYSESICEFTRDEAPMVYKPMEDIVSNIGDTVTIDAVIRPVFNFKASK